MATTAASVSDDAVTARVHASLAERDLLPEKHIADTGFVNAPLFVEAGERYKIELITRSNSSVLREAITSGKQRKRPASPRLGFVIDWNREEATCPEDQVSTSWPPAIDRRKNEVTRD